ncbi:Tm-1-like ATP-binding domain-containing protein [Paenibacillus aestuarii]|uniref:Tm-1-like ATP-binding domain-containing protein n=1 Tax=Paenibacillus aestuarii TaxID=516965 RepID=A0ABW0K6T7_9BACL
MVNYAVIVCALDTKGIECKYMKDLIEAEGLQTLVINTGIIGAQLIDADVGNEEIARLGGSSLAKLIQQGDRGIAVETMMNGTVAKLAELYCEGKVGGIISLGGSAGTTIGTAAMRALPIGVPKVMLSTIASGNTRPYVGMTDVTMVNSIVDISGLNQISRKTLANAAFSLVGMMKGHIPETNEMKPIIAATMFGVTTPCVTAAKEYLEQRGYEVLAFHATGIGGQAMESLIESGLISGVLDITTTELADDIAGGLLSAGPRRLEAAAAKGIPQVVSVGALDMANFAGLDTVPESLRARKLYKHNPNVTLIRTTVDENKLIGEMIASKLNPSLGPTAVFLPLKGVSALDDEGKPFFGPEEDKALFSAIRQNLNSNVQLLEFEAHINDEGFAVAMAETLLNMIENK